MLSNEVRSSKLPFELPELEAFESIMKSGPKLELDEEVASSLLLESSSEKSTSDS